MRLVDHHHRLWNSVQNRTEQHPGDPLGIFGKKYFRPTYYKIEVGGPGQPWPRRPPRGATGGATGNCALELAGFHKTAVRLPCGKISLNICTRFGAVCGALATNPVKFPPGRARLVTSPSSTRSPIPAPTIGISDVASFAACTPSDPPATMISTLRSTRSLANSESRALLAS